METFTDMHAWSGLIILFKKKNSLFEFETQLNLCLLNVVRTSLLLPAVPQPLYLLHDDVPSVISCPASAGHLNYCLLQDDIPAVISCPASASYSWVGRIV